MKDGGSPEGKGPLELEINKMRKYTDRGTDAGSLLSCPFLISLSLDGVEEPPDVEETTLSF